MIILMAKREMILFMAKRATMLCLEAKVVIKFMGQMVMTISVVDRMMTFWKAALALTYLHCPPEEIG